MIAVYVIIAVIVLLLLLLFLPLCVSLKYQESFSFSIRFGGVLIPVKKEKKKPQKEKAKKEEPQKEQPKKKNFMVEYAKENGLQETVSRVCRFARRVMERSLWLFRKIQIRHLNFSLSVATKNAADTAVLYGSVCAAIYPFFSFLHQQFDCKSEHIDVSADFEGEQSRFEFSADVQSNLFFLLITALSVFRYYRKFQHEVKRGSE